MTKKKRKRKRWQRRGRRQPTPRRPVSGNRRVLQELADDIQHEGILPDSPVVFNPPGYEKMSEVLGDFIEPYVDETENTEQYEKLVALAISAWNAAIMSDDHREEFIARLLQVFPVQDRAFARAFLNELIQRKQALFPHIDRYIVDYRVSDMGDSYHLAVASLLPADAQNHL